MVGNMASALASGKVVGAGAIEVTLRAPVPIDIAMRFQFSDEGGVTLMEGDDVLATAKHAELDVQVPEPPTADAARSLRASSLSLKPGFHQQLGARIGVHPICFCCGVEPEEGYGLRVFPSIVEGRDDVTALWTPHENFADENGLVGPQMIAAAIDCPGAFAFLENDQRAGLLGRMTVEFVKDLKAGDETRIVGWRMETDGRKMMAGTAIFDSAGDLVAKAKQIWFGLPEK